MSSTSSAFGTRWEFSCSSHDVVQPPGEVVEVTTSADHPARAVGRGEVVRDVGERHDDGVAPAHPACAVPFHRGSPSTNVRRAYLPSRHWSTGR